MVQIARNAQCDESNVKIFESKLSTSNSVESKEDSSSPRLKLHTMDRNMPAR